MHKKSEVSDKLHVPHISILQWYGQNEINATSSNNDKGERKFGVRYFLEDLRAGTKFVHLDVNEKMSQHITIENKELNIWFEKNKSGQLESILAEIFTVGCLEAFKKSSHFIFSILSTLCFFYRRPLRVGVIIVCDEKHNFNMRTQKYCPQAENLIKPLASLSYNPISSLFSIYREGMNSVDLAYRYICFFKIYEGWHEHHEKFFEKPKEELSKLTIKISMLGSSYRESIHKRFIDKLFDDPDIYKEL